MRCALKVSLLPKSSHCRVRMRTMHNALGKLREFGIKQVCPLCRADLPPGLEQLSDDAMRRYMVLYRRYNSTVEHHGA